MLWIRLACLCRGQRTVTISLIEHFGDIVACEPVARHVRKTRPNAYIIWCLRWPYRELMEHHPDVDRILVVNCLTEWILLRRFKIAGEFVDLHPRGRKCSVCNRPLEKSEGEPGLNILNYYNFGSLLQAFCRSAGLSEMEETAPRVYIPESAVETVDRLNLPEEFVIFHARSNESARNWNEKKWAELLESIRTDLKIFTIEVGLSPALVSSSPRYRSLCGQVSFIELAEVIRRANLFIGVDSGPAHLANAVECPGVILLGRYHQFSNYFPYDGFFAQGGATVVRTNGALSSLETEKVLSAVENKLSAIRARAAGKLGSAYVNRKAAPPKDS